MTRNSWDTTIKHLARENLLCQILNKDQLAIIPRSNISRWKKEPKEKYQFSELNKIIQQELDLIKKINQSSKIKYILKSYFHLSNTLFEIIGNVKNIKSKISTQKELIVNAIEQVRSFIPINDAIKIFNISRTTFEKYKSLVIHKCNPSYFNWCTKRFSKQLLSKEVLTIKSYLSHEQYKHWSKSSIYLKAVRDSKLFCSLSGNSGHSDHPFPVYLDKALEQSSITDKQQIISSIFPEKIHFDGKQYRTTKMNEFVCLLLNIDKGCKSIKKGQLNKNIKLTFKAPPLGLEPRTL